LKKYIWIIISLALVLAMAAGCGSSGSKTFDRDRGGSSDEQDDAEVQDDADDESDGESDGDEAQTEDPDTGDKDTGDTQGDVSNPDTSSGGTDGSIVGVWCSWKGDWKMTLPASYAQKLINTDMTDSAKALALVDEVKGDSAITESVFVYIYRQDGTGFSFHVTDAGYGWETYNYRVEGSILHKTNRLYNSENDNPDWTYKDKKNDDNSSEFRISEKDGTERLFVMPNIPEDDEMASWTVEEYIEWMYDGEWRLRLG